MNKAEWEALTQTGEWRDVTAHMHRSFERFVEGIRKRSEMQQRATSGKVEEQDFGEPGSVREMGAIINQALIYAGLRSGYSPPAVTIAIKRDTKPEIFTNLHMGAPPESVPAYSVWWVLRQGLRIAEAQLLMQHSPTLPGGKYAGYLPPGWLFKLRMAWRKFLWNESARIVRRIGHLPGVPWFLQFHLPIQKYPGPAEDLQHEWYFLPFDPAMCEEVLGRMNDGKASAVEFGKDGTHTMLRLFNARRLGRNRYGILYGAYPSATFTADDPLRPYRATVFFGRAAQRVQERQKRTVEAAMKKSGRAIDKLAGMVK